MKLPRIGLQLYTVRDALVADLDGTLGAIAAAGYREVELDEYFDKTPGEWRRLLEHHGLAAPATHIRYKDLGEGWPRLIETALAVGHRYLVVGRVTDDVLAQPDGWRVAAATFRRAGAESKKAGIQLAYHNHLAEFVPAAGRLPLEILLAECGPEYLQLELDTAWAVAAGLDPAAWFEKHPGRFPLVHVKDLKRVPAAPVARGGPRPKIAELVGDLADVGQGIIDWPRVLGAARAAGAEHYIVEHDRSPAPLETVRASGRYLLDLDF